MFTGIVTALGEIRELDQRGDLRVVVSCPFDPARVDMGASISCSGVCLTVVGIAGTSGAAEIAFDVSGETVSRTAATMWTLGRKLNLEPALRLGDELGGHLVTGHVDGVGTVMSVEELGGSRKIAIRTPADLAPFIAPKGSVTIDGVSLTVNAVEDLADGQCDLSVNIIPHTADVTTLGTLAPGDPVNIEIDVLARYLKRMQGLAR